MRVDVMAFPRGLVEMGDPALRARAAGYDGMLFTEGGRTAFPAVGPDEFGRDGHVARTISDRNSS